MNRIDLELLTENDACPKGYRWFKKNFPKGVDITEKGMKKLFQELLKREDKEKNYFNDLSDNIFEDTVLAIAYLEISPNYRWLHNACDLEKKKRNAKNLTKVFFKKSSRRI